MSLHPNEVDLLRIGKAGRTALGDEARALGYAYAHAFNEQVARQSASLASSPTPENTDG